MTPEELIARGRRAEVLLNDETLNEAFVAIESDTLRRMALPPTRTTPQEREWQYTFLQAQVEFRKALAQFLREGHFEAVTLEKLQAKGAGTDPRAT